MDKRNRIIEEEMRKKEKEQFRKKRIKRLAQKLAMGAPFNEPNKYAFDSPPNIGTPLAMQETFDDGLKALIESKKIELRRSKDGKYGKS